MKIPVIILVLLGFAALILIAVCVYQRARIYLLRRRLKTAMHNSVEISNFLALFSRNLKTKAEFDNWMNVTARYVAELVDAQSVCIFGRDGDLLRAGRGVGTLSPAAQDFQLCHDETEVYSGTAPARTAQDRRRHSGRRGADESGNRDRGCDERRTGGHDRSDCPD